MMKRLARSCLAAGCRTSMLLRRAEQRARHSLVVLCYHRILPAARKAEYFLPDLVVTPNSFRHHCLTLRRHYEVMPLHRAAAALHDGWSSPRPLAAITFDDGYRDNFQYAAPILHDTGLQATFFVISSLVGTQAPPWVDRLGRAISTSRANNRSPNLADTLSDINAEALSSLSKIPTTTARDVVNEAKRRSPEERREWVNQACNNDQSGDFPDEDRIMDWDQLAQLLKAGHEVGSHSATHEILPQLDDTTLDHEIYNSYRLIQDNLGYHPHSFCYPNGNVDNRVADTVAAAGYKWAVTTQPGTNSQGCDPYRLKRWFIHEGRLAGPGGRPSATLLRMELCNLADRVFARRPSVAAF